MRALAIFLLLFQTSIYSFSQSPEVSKKNKMTDRFTSPNSITLTGTFEGELLFLYERLIGRRHSIDLGYGKKWEGSETSLSNKTDQAGLYGGNFYNLGYRYYFGFNSDEPSAFYISPLLFYKDYSFDHTYIIHHAHEDENHYDTQIRSSNKKVYGGKLLFGYKFNFPIIKGEKRSLNFILDFYTGLGLRYKTFDDKLYATGWTENRDDCKCPYLSQPQIEQNPDGSKSPVLSVHLGGRIGIGF